MAPGVRQPGALNAITDVDGVRVGHVTLVEGSGIRTGVTVILPHGGNLFQLWLASSGTSVGTANVSATALRFFFKVTLKTPRSCRGAHLDPRASPPARCSEPGGGRSAARRSDEHQAASSAAIS